MRDAVTSPVGPHEQAADAPDARRRVRDRARGRRPGGAAWGGAPGARASSSRRASAPSRASEAARLDRRRCARARAARRGCSSGLRAHRSSQSFLRSLEVPVAAEARGSRTPRRAPATPAPCLVQQRRRARHAARSARAGRWSRAGERASHAAATASIVASSSGRAMTWRPTGRPLARRRARDADRREPGEARRQRVDVAQVHRERVVRLLAERNAGVGDVGRADDVDLLERLLEVAADERADLLRLQVVRVVVAGGEHERAEQDAALHLGAEARVARRAVHRAQVASRPAPMRAGRSARRRSARGCSTPRPSRARSTSRRRSACAGASPGAAWQPSSSSAAMACADALRRPPGRGPPAKYSSGTPMRSPRTPRPHARLVVVDGRVERRRVARVVPGDDARARAPRRARRSRRGRSGRGSTRTR